MAEVYFYIPAEFVDNAVACGLKLSRWADKEVTIQGDTKRCISALLNPKDDLEKYKSSHYKCLKLELDSKFCFVGDRYLYEMGLHSPGIMEMYVNTILPVEAYIFGHFRLPECLVTSTVLEGQISVLDKRLDSPVLFDKSEDLYMNNIIEAYKETYDDFNDVMLYSFYSKLAETGKIDKIENSDQRMAVFYDRSNDKTYAIRVPDFNLFG